MELSPFEHFRVLKEGHDENVNIFFPFLSRLFQRKCISPSLSPRGILPRAARELTFPQSQPGAVRTRSERGEPTPAHSRHVAGPGRHFLGTFQRHAFGGRQVEGGFQVLDSSNPVTVTQRRGAGGGVRPARGREVAGLTYFSDAHGVRHGQI